MLVLLYKIEEINVPWFYLNGILDLYFTSKGLIIRFFNLDLQISSIQRKFTRNSGFMVNKIQR